MNIFKKIIIDYNNVKKKETWLYSAGFNIEKNSLNLSRIEEELDDLKNLIKKKCRIFLLTHQGDFKKKTSRHLYFLKSILKKKLKVKVSYFDGKIDKYNMINLLKKTGIQSVTIVGNTRLQKGEQTNSKKIAKIYSLLSSKIIIGGFSKAHRKNASNNSIVDYSMSYLSLGVSKEIQKLERWKKFSKENYIIFLGGVKKEKVNLGLGLLAKNFKIVVPSGLILNTILKQLNYQIGKSKYFRGKTFKTIRSFLKRYKSKIFLPNEVIVTNFNYKKKRVCSISSIKRNDIIGGFLLSKDLISMISKCKKKSKILLSGTPSFTEKKIYEPTNSISKHLRKKSKNLLILGGDSANDLRFANSSNISSGGGAGLSYLALNRLEVIDKLRSKVR